MLIKLIICLGLINKPIFILAIAKIEYGVAIFCKKLASELSNLGKDYSYLVQLLECQSQEEVKHGKMLSSLILKINLKDNGQCLTKFRPATGEYIVNVNQDKYISSPVSVEWDSLSFPGEKIQATYENFDGISKRYLSARLLFNGRSASTFDLVDKLAFMHVLEQETCRFYTFLARITKGTALGAIALTIAADEKHHADYLKSKINHFIPFTQNINKWQNKITVAKWAILFDLCFLATGIIAKNLFKPNATNHK
jgi:rubrerythrin